MKRIFLLLPGLTVMLGMLGCKKGSEAVAATLPAPMVTVANPVMKPVVWYEYFEGRLESTEQVEIRARVSGYLDKIHFKPGTEVQKGSRLFDIDPRPFEADVAQVKGTIERTQALLDRLKLDLARNEKLVKSGAVSQEDFDKIVGDKLAADATLKADKAKLTGSELNLSYTRIDAPISGLIGDKLVTEGNLIQGGQANTTLLTTIVAVDRMYLTFYVAENILQRIQENVRTGKLKAAGDKIPVEMGLSVHGKEFPLSGKIVFINNQVESGTGTIRVKAEFDNPPQTVGKRQLIAGMYARLRVRIGDPVDAVVVPDKALSSDQGTKFIFVVGDDNKAKRLNVNIGGLNDGMRVIESVQGADDKEPRPLKLDERVIVTGIQRVRPGMTVDAKKAVEPMVSEKTENIPEKAGAAKTSATGTSGK